MSDPFMKFSELALKKSAERDIALMKGTKELLLRNAELVVGVAQNIGPHGATGAYVAGIKAETGETKEGAFARVIANDFKSGWIEFGTIFQPAQHVLTRACEAVLGQSVQAHKHAEGV